MERAASQLHATVQNMPVTIKLLSVLLDVILSYITEFNLRSPWSLNYEICPSFVTLPYNKLETLLCRHYGCVRHKRREQRL
jgi:hypothetical protein